MTAGDKSISVETMSEAKTEGIYTRHTKYDDSLENRS